MVALFRIRWPWKSALLLVTLLTLWLVSYRWQPRGMLWWGQGRGAVGVTNGRVEAVWVGDFADRQSFAPSITGWVEWPEPPPPLPPGSFFCATGSPSSVFTDEPRRPSYVDVEHVRMERVMQGTIAAPPVVGFLGASMSRATSPGGLFVEPDPYAYLAAQVPLWQLASLAAAITVWLAWRAWRSRHLLTAGHCARCGYDLRASLERCPECGAAVRMTRGLAVRRKNVGKLRRALWSWEMGLRRNLVWALALACMLVLAFRRIPPPTARVLPIADTEAFLKSQLDHRGADTSGRFLVVYDISDMLAAPPEPEKDEGLFRSQRPSRFEFLNSPEVGHHGVTDIRRPYLAARLDADGHRALITHLNLFRSQQ